MSPFSEQRVLDDMVCRRCQYALRGLEVSGRCPECGTPTCLGVPRCRDWRQRVRFVLFTLLIAVGLAACNVGAAIGGLVLVGVVPVLMWIAWIVGAVWLSAAAVGRRVDWIVIATVVVGTVVAYVAIVFNMCWMIAIWIS